MKRFDLKPILSVIMGLVATSVFAQTTPNPPGDFSVEGGSQVEPTRPPETQAEMNADFEARAAAYGNIWANNFTDIYEGGVLNSARTISSTQDIYDDSNAQGIGTGEALNRESTVFLSGTGSVDTQTFDTTTSGDGSYNFYANGRDSTPLDQYYLQFSVYYPRDTIAWRYPVNGSTSLKIANFGTYGNGQFVLAIDRFMGFPAGFINGNKNISQSVGSTFSSQGNPWGTTLMHTQNAIDAGLPSSPATKTEWLNRYGYLLRGLDQDMDITCADPRNTEFGTVAQVTPWLDQREHAGFGWPDQRAAKSGRAINIDGWTTFEVYIDRAAGTLRIWMANYGEPPQLIWEGVGNVPFGSGSSIARHYLLNYDTKRLAEPGVRPSPQHTYYDELIVSHQPIKFPGGYELP